jgi:DNA mismatch endonuclease, patch repair protein
MSRIKGKDTKPEILVRRFLFSNGFRYRLHDKRLPGKPDLVLLKHKAVVFIHGCYWHGHQGCKYFVVPKTRTEWWLNKIMGNQSRDRGHATALLALGWRVIIVWECELKKDTKDHTLDKLMRDIQQK